MRAASTRVWQVSMSEQNKKRASRARPPKPREGDAGRKRRRDLEGAAVNLPNWVVEALVRVTPKERVPDALEALGTASEALADGRYHVAVKQGQRAKALAPQDATTRETLGIALYRVGDWAESLRELRTYRRMSGDTTHLPVEMDTLRALGRGSDVERAWETLQERGARPAVMKEGVVVYASHLIDAGDYERAWRLTKPKGLRQDPSEAELRLWYVAARSAALRGDGPAARELADAIVTSDPGFPGIDELEREIAAASR